MKLNVPNPSWLIIKKNLTWDGVPGVLMDSEHGCPSGCTVLYEWAGEGVSKRRKLADTRELKNPYDIDFSAFHEKTLS